jgi:predicted GNAT family acetyltransferase
MDRQAIDIDGRIAFSNTRAMVSPHRLKVTNDVLLSSTSAAMAIISALDAASQSTEVSHPLDRVIWEALVSRHKSLALGDNCARRYPTEIAPFGATVNERPENYRSLLRLLSPGDRVALLTPEPISPPPELVVVKRDMVDQMMLAAKPTPPGTTQLINLCVTDLPEMRHLVELTKPGPFGARTIELGDYLGIRIDGALVAAAGERMKLDGFTEISAVCVHPSRRGQGLAAELIAALARSIMLRHEVPFLHVFVANKPAINLYRKLGFSVRRRMDLAVLQIAMQTQIVDARSRLTPALRASAAHPQFLNHPFDHA